MIYFSLSRKLFIYVFVMISLTVLISCKTINQNISQINEEKSESSEKINLRDPNSRVDTILTLAEREVRMPVGPNGFPRSPWQVMDLIQKLYSTSNEALQDLVIPKDSVQYEYAFEGEDYRVNESAIQEIKNDLESNKELIVKTLNRPLHSLLKDTTELKEKITKEKLDPKLLNKLLLIAPAVYESNTDKYLASTKKISDLTHSDLANIYKDTYPEHMAPELRNLFSPESITSFENQFINKKLASALTFLKGSSGKVPKMVLLEQISGFAGVFRACYGNDCSLRSVPFYSLDEKTKVYLIRTQAGGKVKGYILVTEGRIGDKTYPYVITVNGSLSKDQVKASVKLVASIAKSSEILLPNFKTADAIVNTPEMAEGMKHESETRSVIVEMSKGWQRISSFTAENNKTTYRNYYTPKSLEKAFLGPVLQINFKTEMIKDAFKSGALVRTKPLLEKAKLAAVLKDNLDKANFDRVVEYLNVNQAQIDAAKPLNAISENVGIEREAYEAAKKELSFGEKDIAELHPLSTARVLISLAPHQKELSEINFEKEAVDYSKWSASQLSATTLPVEDVAAHKQKVWVSFVELSATVAIPKDVMDRVVRVRPDSTSLNELIFKDRYPERILSSVVRISHKEEINKIDRSGYTPIMIAAINGFNELYEELLKAGADTKIKNSAGEDLMDIAIRLRRNDIIQDLNNRENGMASSTIVDPSSKKDENPCDTIEKKSAS